MPDVPMEWLAEPLDIEVHEGAFGVLEPTPQDVQDAFHVLYEQQRDEPQTPLETLQILHAGVYTRTIRIPEGLAVLGVKIKRETQLVVCGDATINNGAQAVHLVGYHVFAAKPGRQQLIIAHRDTWMTMTFATDAKTAQEAEDEFTDDADLLQTRKLKE